MEEDLVLFLQATWCQKQLDDLLLMNQSVLMSLKKEPFHPQYLEKRNKIHHDINKLQPIVLQTGLKCAETIEKKYGVSFCLLSGRDRPVPSKEEGEADKKPPMIVAPDGSKL